MNSGTSMSEQGLIDEGRGRSGIGINIQRAMSRRRRAD